MGRCGEAVGDRAGGALVGLRAPGAVDAEGRHSPAAVAQAAGHGADVDASGDQLGGGVVAQILDVHVPTEAGAHPRVPLGDRARGQPGRPRGVTREQIAVLREIETDCGQLGFQGRSVRPQQRHRRRIERDLPTLMSLGVLLQRLGASARRCDGWSGRRHRDRHGPSARRRARLAGRRRPWQARPGLPKKDPSRPRLRYGPPAPRSGVWGPDGSSGGPWTRPSGWCRATTTGRRACRRR